jgi:hypothetical protein
MTADRRVDLLTGELVWQADGHLADVAVIALADAQDVLPEDAHSHMAACEDCARRVGEAALVSFGMREAMAVRRLRPAAAPRPLPIPAVALALALAAAGVAPLLMDLPRSLPHTVAALVHLAPVLVRGASAAVRGVDSPSALIVSSVSLLVALVAVWGVARLTPTRLPARGMSKEGVLS